MGELKKLTQRQAEVLSFIVESIKQNGFAPTMVEIAHRFGFLSPNAASSHVCELERKGYLRRTRGAARAIVPTIDASSSLPHVSALPAEQAKSEWQTALELFIYEPSTGNFYSRFSPGGSLRRVGFINSRGYVDISFDGANVSGHRLAWLYVTGKWPSQSIDHINGIRADNRFENLRDASPEINAQNQRRARAGSASGLLGAHKNTKPTGLPWRSRIRVNGRVIELGEFETPEQAHRAYVDAKRTYHLGCTI